MGLLCSNQYSTFVVTRELAGDAPLDVKFEKTIDLKVKQNTSQDKGIGAESKMGVVTLNVTRDNNGKVTFAFPSGMDDKAYQLKQFIQRNEPNLEQLAFKVPLEVEYQVVDETTGDDLAKIKGTVETKMFVMLKSVLLFALQLFTFNMFELIQTQ